MAEGLSQIVLSLAVFFPVFTLIVVVHECGHLFAGRACGIKADVFSVGFGPSVCRWTDKYGTIWQLSALPLGGYVKFAGDFNPASMPARGDVGRSMTAYDAEHGAGAAAHSFQFKTIWQRAFVVLAGPLANLVLAVVIFAALFMSVGQLRLPVVVTSVSEGSAAAAAGVVAGDRIVSINGEAVRHFDELRSHYVPLYTGRTAPLVVERAGQLVSMSVTIARLNNGATVMGRPVSVGRLGIGVTLGDGDVPRRLGPVSAMGEGALSTWRTLRITGVMLSRLVTGRQSLNAITGVPGMMQMAGGATRQTIETGQARGQTAAQISAGVGRTMFILAALLSISIGVMNLLPILPLDGGHLVVYGYEAMARRPLGEAVLGWCYTIGLVLVGSAFVFFSLNDLRWMSPI